MFPWGKSKKVRVRRQVCSEPGGWSHRPVLCGKPDRLTRLAAFVFGNGVWDGSRV
jgi:hypothetical protein